MTSPTLQALLDVLTAFWRGSALGLLLAWHIGAFYQGWFHAKLTLLLLLTGYHGWMVGYSKKVAAGQRTMAGKTLRMVNEIPALIAIFAVILVIVKPF